MRDRVKGSIQSQIVLILTPISVFTGSSTLAAQTRRESDTVCHSHYAYEAVTLLRTERIGGVITVSSSACKNVPY